MNTQITQINHIFSLRLCIEQSMVIRPIRVRVLRLHTQITYIEKIVSLYFHIENSMLIRVRSC